MKIQNHKRVLKKKRDVTELDSVEDVAEEIRFRLWEKKRHMIRDLVKVIGIPVALELMAEVTEIERQVSFQNLDALHFMCDAATASRLSDRFE